MNGMRSNVNISCVAFVVKQTTNVSGGISSNSSPDDKYETGITGATYVRA